MADLRRFQMTPNRLKSWCVGREELEIKFAPDVHKWRLWWEGKAENRLYNNLCVNGSVNRSPSVSGRRALIQMNPAKIKVSGDAADVDKAMSAFTLAPCPMMKYCRII